MINLNEGRQNMALSVNVAILRNISYRMNFHFDTFYLFNQHTFPFLMDSLNLSWGPKSVDSSQRISLAERACCGSLCKENSVCPKRLFRKISPEPLLKRARLVGVDVC